MTESVTASFEGYVAARWSRLVRSAVMMGSDLHAAEDAVQSTFARCYYAWGKVQCADDPDAYVHRILINTLKDTHRRSSARERPTLQMPERGVPDATVQVGESQALLDALRALPEGQRQVVVLRYYADFSEAQTAQTLGIPVGTVKSRCARALASLAVDSRLSDPEHDHKKGSHR